MAPGFHNASLAGLAGPRTANGKAGHHCAFQYFQAHQPQRIKHTGPLAGPQGGVPPVNRVTKSPMGCQTQEPAATPVPALRNQSSLPVSRKAANADPPWISRPARVKTHALLSARCYPHRLSMVLQRRAWHLRLARHRPMSSKPSTRTFTNSHGQRNQRAM